MALSRLTREALIGAMKRFAAGGTGRVSMKGFCGAVPTSVTVINRLFPGGPAELRAAAGLAERYSRAGRVNEDLLMREIRRLSTVLGRPPMAPDVDRHGRIRPGTYRRQIGPWPLVMERYEKWAARNPDAGAAPAIGGTGRSVPEPLHEVGSPLGFRGLVFAPVNEIGVVHLFGLLGPDLGIAVEHIGSAYPDCRGLRMEPA